jgi:hypothetical protein
MRHKDKGSEGEIHETLCIHEVYYKDDLTRDVLANVGDTGYTERAVAPVAEDLDGLRFVLTEMLKALDKPIMEYS